MLGWIPIIGPVVDGIVAIFSKFKDVEAIKYKTDGEVSIEGFKASANIIETTKDDIGIRLARDIVIYPVAIWSALIGWDTIVVKRWPELMFHIEKYPESVAYLPYAVIVFLLGNIGLNIWRRK
jgi:hypothetical protein